jgi:hypothetical protein
MTNLKVVILRNDFVGETIADKAKTILAYNEALLSLLNDTDLLKCFGLLTAYVFELKNTTTAANFAKLRAPFSKQAEKVLTYIRLEDTTVGFLLSDLGIENFLIQFSNKKVFTVNPNDSYLKLVSLFPSLISYIKFDYDTFKKDLLDNRISDLTLDILRSAVGNNFILETSVSSFDVVSKKNTVDSFAFDSAKEVE